MQDDHDSTTREWTVPIPTKHTCGPDCPHDDPLWLQWIVGIAMIATLIGLLSLIFWIAGPTPEPTDGSNPDPCPGGSRAC